MLAYFSYFINKFLINHNKSLRLKSSIETLNDNIQLLILQIHPNSWKKKSSFLEFKLIIYYLKSLGCEFINPNQLDEVIANA